MSCPNCGYCPHCGRGSSPNHYPGNTWGGLPQYQGGWMGNIPPSATMPQQDFSKQYEDFLNKQKPKQ